MNRPKQAAGGGRRAGRTLVDHPGRRRRPSRPNTISPPAGPRGFTLVELLVVIVIIGLLASMAMGALSAARQTARVAKTRATILKLDRIIMARYESYRTRRVPVSLQGLGPGPARVVRVLALRHLMRLEMPEREQDITLPDLDPTTWVTVATVTDRWGNPFTAAMPRPSLSRAYLRRYNNSSPTDVYQSAEYLYLIVTLGTPDGREQFAANEIGDADGDGWLEFHDGWGNPIAFLRWAPAFNDSDLQANIIPPERMEEGTDWGLTASWSDPEVVQNIQDADEDDHDPFDSNRIDSGAWRLVPLVYSAGPDGIYDINRDAPYEFGGDPYHHPGPAPADRNMSGLPVDSANDSVTATDRSTNGSLDHYDNIHNHRIEATR